MSAAQYEVPGWYMPTLRKRVRALAARVAKCGSEPISMIESPCSRMYKRQVVEFVAVEVRGEMPRINGWTAYARIEHTGVGEIIARFGEGPIGDDERRPICDHCRTERRRRDTFLMSHEDGRMMRVGRSCLDDFTRTGYVEDIAALAAMLEEFQRLDGLDDETWGDDAIASGFAGYSTRDFLTACFASIRVRGWVSRSGTDDGHVSTADAALEIVEKHRSEMTDADKAKAREAIEWASNLEPASEFENNIKVVAKMAHVNHRTLGLAAAIAFAYGRHLADVAVRAARQPSRHFGEVGSRYVRALTVEAAKAIETQWGLSKLIVARDDDGNVFKWFASSCPDCVVGERYAFLFTVDKHEVYRDVRQTVITRAAIATAQTPENFGMKWVRPDGRVCKTKKEMTQLPRSTGAIR